ncbi:MAG: YggS family pyridoxal phosphate-dependent enzyme [Clostridiaceae bacterium]|nr:YggS family pyridoxal phosphate-dependent enzyme [Clostridiaceae bacterium]
MNDSRKNLIENNLDSLREAIDVAAIAAGRDPVSIKLVAVTKSHPLSDIEIALSHGQQTLGENRVQELTEKIEATKEHGLACEWHMIGTLQTNKVRFIVGEVALIHSVDRIRLLRAIEKYASQQGIVQDVLLQVNVSGESSKHGFGPENLGHVLEHQQDFPHIRIMGLMTMAPHFEDPEQTRPVFARLRQLRDELAVKYNSPQLTELSMGMTNDYIQAVGEGATLVRGGSAIFGQQYC